MDIGKEGTPFVIEPLVEPVPGRENTPPPEPEFDPTPEPVAVDPTIRRIEAALTVVGNELTKACDRFQPFNSPHEGWAVIREELDELWEHVRADTGRSDDARHEAIQVAAMALRYYLDCKERT